MITDTGVSVTIARLHIIAEIPMRNLSKKYILQCPVRPTVMEEATVELPLAHTALQIRVFTGKLTDESILGLDILQVYDTIVDLKHSVLRLHKEEVSIWLPGPQPQSATRQYHLGVRQL
jgi:hypothetical protein